MGGGAPGSWPKNPLGAPWFVHPTGQLAPQGTQVGPPSHWAGHESSAGTARRGPRQGSGGRPGSYVAGTFGAGVSGRLRPAGEALVGSGVVGRAGPHGTEGVVVGSLGFPFQVYKWVNRTDEEIEQI